MERLLAQQQFAISAAHQELEQLEVIETNYQQLKERLQNLPKSLRHTVSVPLNSVGFFQGELIHTNEITALLSSDYLVEVSAVKATEIVERRIEQCQSRQDKAKEQLRHYSEWKNFTQRDFEEKTGTVDIKEDFDEIEECRWRQQHAERVRQERRRAQKSAADLSTKADDDALWDRLEQLEIQEQFEKYSSGRQSVNFTAAAAAASSSSSSSSDAKTSTVQESHNSTGSHTEMKSILKRTPSSGSFKSVHFGEGSKPEASVAIDSDDDDDEEDDDDDDEEDDDDDDDDEEETHDTDDIEEDAFTGLIVERDPSGSVVACVGEAPVRLSRFKASKR